MKPHWIFMLAVVFLAGCSTGPRRDTPPSPATVWFHVEGMTKLQGITWLGWPNAVEEALSGLPGIVELRADLKNDRFAVRYDPALTGVDAMLEAVAQAGYVADVIQSGVPEAPSNAAARLDVSRLPPILQSRFEEAQRRQCPVLLRFTGAGWVTCEEMDTVTYPDGRVVAELALWVVVKVDVNEDAKTAQLLGVHAIPVAIVLTPDGKELGRISNAVAPGQFCEQLAGWRLFANWSR